MPMHMFHFKYETGTVWYFTGEATVHDRTKEDTEDNMVEALRTSQHDRGAKEPSALVNLPGCDIAWSFTPDYMHCVLLGVSRQLLEFRLSSVGESYNIGSPQLLGELPHRLPYLPRSIKLRKYWKAVE